MRITILTITLIVLVGSTASFAQEPADLTPPVYQDNFNGEPMKDWLICGPFPIELENMDEARRNRFGVSYDSHNINFFTKEADGSEIDTDAIFTLPEDSPAKWISRKGSTSSDIDLAQMYDRKEFAVAYGYAEIEVSSATEVCLEIGSDDAVKVWLNGKLIHDHFTGRAVYQNLDNVFTELQEGRNTLLIKVLNMESDWGFRCRIMDLGNVPLELLLERQFEAAFREINFYQFIPYAIGFVILIVFLIIFFIIRGIIRKRHEKKMRESSW